MVSKSSIRSCQERRFEAVALHKHHPDWSLRSIAKKMHCNPQFVSTWVARFEQSGHVKDQPRSGRPHKADAAAVQHVVMTAKLPKCFSAADIAAQTQQDLGLKFSTSTVRRVLRKQGLKHLSPKVVPLLTAQHKLDRVKFAKKAMRREHASWLRVLITDSKYFPLYARGKPAGRWCTPATRGTAPRPKKGPAVHAYMGICKKGITKLMFVTGTHMQVSKYVDPKSKRPYKGVGQDEYNDVIRELWVPEGNRLFQHSGKWAGNWQLQQDNAKPHTTPKNMAFIAAHVPGGHFLKWPANSPDLSPIETVWAWMDAKLKKDYKPKNVEELKECLEKVRQSISIDDLEALFDGMDNRMSQCINLGGEHIGK